MKEQTIFDQAGTVSIAGVHEDPHKAADLGCHTLHKQLAFFKESTKKQNELKTLHKLIHFFVLNQCQVVENFFPFLWQQSKCCAQDDARTVLCQIQNFKSKAQPWKTTV